MSIDSPIAQSGSFVEAEGGCRFRLQSQPRGRSALGTVVFVHAFAEEMNKSRRMVARTARALAAAGWEVVQRDLAGCGDSEGEFGEATWSAWQSDVLADVRAVPAGLPIWLWCHRAGALLAPHALAARPDANLLLWQPALSGSQHLQQFLRLHAGARIVGNAGGDATPPLQRLRAGTRVELGGYEISPELALGMEASRLELPLDWHGRAVWLELTALAPSELSLPSTRCVAAWRERGAQVHAEALSGPAFWQTQEIEDCDALIERTVQLVGAMAPASARSAAT